MVFTRGRYCTDRIFIIQKLEQRHAFRRLNVSGLQRYGHQIADGLKFKNQYDIGSLYAFGGEL
ncbi:hypothetical protein T265_08801 [Opisthorchis viverrini]|uniref:Uncharacterized protein n=1 Tax=Opisthorchis viverrini TaxID=6198 RepID=A0A074Z834_OPIVI|nr:hypothetical protein T265_08801 [Opisthorchis viverrini]KER23263.1 hypothetical protein T265_08801 [Opisthorchis viverrini]